MTKYPNSIFESAYNKLLNMEVERKVDLSILDEFNALQKNFMELETYWRKSEKVPIKQAFVLFHSMRNCRIILQKMRLRFEVAKERQQNPQIVYSSQLVLPRINDLYNTIQPLKGREVTKEIVHLVRQRLRSLRDIAANTSMLPTLEEEIRGIPIPELKKKFEIIANDLRAKISEE